MGVVAGDCEWEPGLRGEDVLTDEEESDEWAWVMDGGETGAFPAGDPGAEEELEDVREDIVLLEASEQRSVNLMASYASLGKARDRWKAMGVAGD